MTDLPCKTFLTINTWRENEKYKLRYYFLLIKRTDYWSIIYLMENESCFILYHFIIKTFTIKHNVIINLEGAFYRGSSPKVHKVSGLQGFCEMPDIIWYFMLMNMFLIRGSRERKKDNTEGWLKGLWPKKQKERNMSSTRKGWF